MESTLIDPQQNQDIKEIGITIFGSHLHPAILNLEFLQLREIIPRDWNLVKQPIINPQLTQLQFDNNLTIMAQPGTVTFVDTVGKIEPSNLNAAYVASMYAQNLTQGQYDRVNIGAKIIVACTETQDAARRFLGETLMAMGPWQNIGNSPVQVGLTLYYDLDGAQLNMNINEATLQEPNKPPVSALIFGGAFSHYLIEQTAEGRLNQLRYYIKNWRKDWNTFKDIVYNKFLIRFDGQPETVFPKHNFSG